MPKMIPLVRKNQLRRVQRRVTTSQRESVFPVISAAMPKAKGTEKEVKPR